jgi:bacteriochlorophyllide a dehydrogenase
MNTLAVVLEQPRQLSLARLALPAPGDEDIVVDIEYSGISTGTEKLLWTGRMPQFPGMGYPLVPGYESVGRVAFAGERSGHVVGEYVFVPGARCYGEVRGLFGGTASRVVTGGARVVPVSERLGERAVRHRLPRRIRRRPAAVRHTPRPHRRPWRTRPSAGAHDRPCWRHAGGVGAQS